MPGTKLTREQALSTFDSALAYIQMRLASTGTLGRLLLDYPLEVGAVRAYVPVDFVIPENPCFEEDCITTYHDETQERRLCEAEFISQFLTALPANVAVYSWPTTGQSASGEHTPQTGKLYRYHHTRQGANTSSFKEAYLILSAEEGSIHRILEAEESIPSRHFCCVLAGASSSISASPQRALDEAALGQIVASAEHLLVSAFDHYGRLLWTRRQDAAWSPQFSLTDEIMRSLVGDSMWVELNPASTLDHLYQRLCNSFWRRWLGSERQSTLERVLLCCPQSSKQIQVKFFATSFQDFARGAATTAGEDAHKQAYGFLRSQLASDPGSSVLISGKTSDSLVARTNYRDFILRTSSQLMDGHSVELRSQLHCIDASELSWDRFKGLLPSRSPLARCCCVILRETQGVSQLRSKAEICWEDVDNVLVPATSYLCAGVFSGEFPLFVRLSPVNHY